jgi:hypothetical protein
VTANMNNLNGLHAKSVSGNNAKSSAICDENMLQYTNPGRDSECELTIGLDFGTSASKVVIQAPYLPGSPTYVVDFGRLAHPSMTCLLPSRLWIMDDGKCHLCMTDGSKAIGDIKLGLFTSTDLLGGNQFPTEHGLSPEAAACAYLGLMLRYARRWFLESKQSIIAHFKKLNWSVNLGVPSPCVEENEENKKFRKVGKAAWMLSLLDQDITIDKAKKELHFLTESPEYWERDDDGTNCDFDIVPEIAAGAVGYALSDLRREGAHVMIDVGASTMDVCSFILRQNDQNRYCLLTADVKQLGTIKLHYTRIEAIQKAFDLQAQRLRDKHDPLTPIAEGLESYLLSEDKIRKQVLKAEDDLRTKCQTMIRKVILDFRRRRSPHEDVWRKNKKLPILLIGGGSKLPFFESLIKDLSGWLQWLCGNEGIEVLKVPLPETLKYETEDYHRLAVAWGLSHRSPDIGEIIPADRIPDIDQETRLRWEEFFVGKDQV